MKKTLRALLCAAVLLVTLCIPAFAAGSSPADTGTRTLPEKQGDFYLMLNGEFVTSFTDALPQARDNRSFLPFRHTFELLGFDQIQWQQETSTAIASKDGLTVRVKLGEKAFTITENGETRTLEADTAAYADPKISRTFVPIGLIARALDSFNVAWDGENGVVILDNVDQILADCTETFTLMDGLMDYSRPFSQGTWSQNGSFDLDLSCTFGTGTLLPATGGESMTFTASADGDYTSLTADSSGLQLDATGNLDGSFTVGGKDITDTLALLTGSSGFSFPKTLDFALRGDQSTGTFWFCSKALQDLMAVTGTAASDAWYQMDLGGIWDQAYAGMGLTYRDLLAMEQTDLPFRDQLRTILKGIPVTSMNDTTSDHLDAICAALGDSAFEKLGSTYVNDLSDQMAGTAKIILYTTGESISGIGVNLEQSVHQEGVSDFTLKMDTTQKDSKSDMTMAMELGSGSGANPLRVSIDLTSNATLAASTETPVTEPPAGATTADWPGSGLIPDLGILGGADGPTSVLPAP